MRSHNKWLVNGLLLLGRINAKPLVTILFFQILGKTCNFDVLVICCAVPLPANHYILIQK